MQNSSKETHATIEYFILLLLTNKTASVLHL